MKIGVCYRRPVKRRTVPQFIKNQPPIRHQVEAVTTSSITENDTGTRIKRDRRRAPPGNPGFDRQLLELQGRWVSDVHHVTRSIEQKSLPNSSHPEGRISPECPLV